MFGFLNDTQQKNTNGIGLGLMISNKLVIEFGGQFDVISKLGKGSSFIFTIKLESNIDTALIGQHEEDSKSWAFKWRPKGNEGRKIHYAKFRKL